MCPCKASEVGGTTSSALHLLNSCTLASSVFVTFSTWYNLQTNSSASWNLDVVRSPSPRCWSSLYIWRIRSMPFSWCGQKSRRQCHNRLLRGKQEELSTVHRFREWKFLSDFMDRKVLLLLRHACLHPQLVALHAGEEEFKKYQQNVGVSCCHNDVFSLSMNAV